MLLLLKVQWVFFSFFSSISLYIFFQINEKMCWCLWLLFWPDREQLFWSGYPSKGVFNLRLPFCSCFWAIFTNIFIRFQADIRNFNSLTRFDLFSTCVGKETLDGSQEPELRVKGNNDKFSHDDRDFSCVWFNENPQERIYVVQIFFSKTR